MVDVLITGGAGFIGKNLKLELLKVPNVKVHESSRDTSLRQLKETIANVDFIYHLAGEVRPKSDEESFKQGNIDSTEMLLRAIASVNKPTPIVLASTVHAITPQNAYGHSKRAAEELLEDYGEECNAPVWIYRLPHLFGEACKPNYNSVITTWIYNSIHDLDIAVYNRDTPMTYTYVQDLVMEFARLLRDDARGGVHYCSPVLTYNTTLGEVVDFIGEFKGGSQETGSRALENEFKSKLSRTYKWYKKANDET